MKKVYGITTCKRCGAKIYEVDYDYDLTRFDVYNNIDEYVSTVYPYNIKEMKELNSALKDGECPICDKWEDGLGRILGDDTE